jgi:DNA-binding response OmpR family regulator
MKHKPNLVLLDVSDLGSTEPKILIVEDDISLGKFLSRALKLKHFAVEVSLDGEAAWETCRNPSTTLQFLISTCPGWTEWPC